MSPEELDRLEAFALSLVTCGEYAGRRQIVKRGGPPFMTGDEMAAEGRRLLALIEKRRSEELHGPD
jgi:hypothetical protein